MDKLALKENILFCFVYICRTLTPFWLQTVFWGTYLPLRAACLFGYGKKTVFLSCKYKNSKSNLHLAPLKI